MATSILLAALASAGTRPARATSATWTGGGLNSWDTTYWNDTGNWSNGTVPSGWTDISLGDAFWSGRNIYATNTLLASTIDLRNAPDGFRLTWGFGGPYSLILLNGLTREFSCGGQQLIQLPVYLWQPSLWTVKGSGRLRVDGDITGPAPQRYRYSGLTKDGPGELALYGNNSWTGTTSILDGRLTAGSSTALKSGSGIALTGDSSRHPELHLATSLAGTLAWVTLGYGSKVTASYGAALSAAAVYFTGVSELAAPLVGQSDVQIYPNANAVISQAGSFTGNVTIQSNATLTSTVGQGALGAAGNHVNFGDGARLVVQGGGVLGPSRTLAGQGSTAFIDGPWEIDSTFTGSALFHLITPPSIATLTLTGSSASFTGKIMRDSGNLIAASSGSLGSATQIFLNVFGTQGTLELQAPNAASATPSLSLGTQGVLANNDFNANFNVLDVGTTAATIQLTPDGINSTLTFNTIAMDTSAFSQASLLITGWSGSPGSPGTEDTIFFAFPQAQWPSDAVLSRIQFANKGNGAMIILDTGELVPKP